MLVQVVNIEKSFYSLSEGEISISFVRTGIFFGVCLRKGIVPNFPLNL